MSAESAQSSYDALDPDAGAVIRLSDHSPAHRHRHRHRPERDTVACQEPSPGQKLTEHMEALFNVHGRTLTDEETAQVFGISMDAVLMMIDGALVQGQVGKEQHRTLRGMAEGMRDAPHML